MIPVLGKIGYGALLAASLGGIVYLAAAVLSVFAFSRRRVAPPADHCPPATVLKPVCGLDHGLYENLRSFCDQDYPEFQVIFGVGDAGDPAVPVIRRVIGEFPGRDLLLAVGKAAGEGNRKVANLANMFRDARHDLIVIADSDMRVGRGYLRAVASPFADPGVGAATCVYSGTPAGGAPSALGALYINDWFLPSVLVALSFQQPRFCFGATMAVRREALAAIGGFEALAPYLADDYMLGELVARRGYEVRLCPYVVEAIVAERDFGALFAHELRWARTVRACRPLGYAFSIVGNGAVSLAALFFAASRFSAWGAAPLAAALLLRTALHFSVRSAVRVPGPAAPWLIPVRDPLCVAIWAASFAGRGVRWRTQSLAVDPDGRVRAEGAWKGR